MKNSGVIEVKRLLLKSMIHRARVREANVDYIGSITIDEDLMEKADLAENEAVYVIDRTNGNRIKTYVIKGERGSGIIAMNGAAAHLVREGDDIDIMAFSLTSRPLTPLILRVDEENRFERYLERI